eukprot:740547_1
MIQALVPLLSVLAVTNAQTNTVYDLKAEAPAECLSSFTTSQNWDFKPVANFSYNLLVTSNGPIMQFETDITGITLVKHVKNGISKNGTGLITLGFNANGISDYESDNHTLQDIPSIDGIEFGFILRSSSLYNAVFEWNGCALHVLQQYSLSDISSFGGTVDNAKQTLEGNVQLISTSYDEKGRQLAKYLES